jgi:gliding motility-associated-like protein
VVVTITADPNAGTDGNTTVCDTDPAVDLFGLLGGTPNTGGVWSPALSSGTGVFNPAVDAGGNYTYSIITSCGTFSSIVDVTLNVSDDATFSYASDSFCIDGTNPMASINGTNGGVFTISAGGMINAANGTLDLAGSGVGTFDVTYTTNGPCPDVFTLTINILDISDATITPVGPFCSYDAPILLQAAQSGGTWSGTGVDPVTGEFNPSLGATGLNPITYTIDGLCGDVSTIQIEVIPAPVVSTIEDVSIMFGNSVNLIATGNASAYTWTPGETLVCDDCQNTIATPDQTTTYTVWVEENGCSASDQVTITIEYEPIVFVPNIFSPNSDGQNDILYVRGQGILNFTFMVYDRWGEKVYESTALENGWDGTFRGQEMIPAVFMYVVDVNFTNGSSQVISGDVTLVR